MKKVFVVMMMILFLTGCGIGNDSEEKHEVSQASTEQPGEMEGQTQEYIEQLVETEGHTMDSEFQENSETEKIEEDEINTKGGAESSESEGFPSKNQSESESTMKENNSSTAPIEQDKAENSMKNLSALPVNDINADNVTKILVRSGTDGAETMIEEEGLIYEILDSLKSFSVDKAEAGSLQGYLYSIGLYNDDVFLQNLMIRGDSVEVNGVIYYVGSTQGLIEQIK